MKRIRRLVIGLLACLTVAPGPGGEVAAHEIRPALLEINETEPGWFEVTWKVPMRGGRKLAITPTLPDSLEAVGPVARRTVPGASVENSSYRSDVAALVGESIVIEGLTALQIDVLVQISLADGTRHSTILRPMSPSFTVPERESKWAVAGSYWRMGVLHILEGIDHLLFVLALLIIVSGFWNLLKTITAFTVAHSITLALATLGAVHVPPGPTEAIIALSIVFLAAEIIRQRIGIVGLTERYPWVIAFIFGLFHGLGFAGALSEIGVPQDAVPLALLMFNIGVETGQVLFIVVVLGALTLLKRLPVSPPAGAWRVAPYAVGSIAAFWTIERIATFV